MTDTETTPTPTPSTSYTPTFSEKVRTAIYVVGLIASVVGLGFMTFGDAAIGGFISTAAGIIAAGTGVAYNPIALNNRKA